MPLPCIEPLYHSCDDWDSSFASVGKPLLDFPTVSLLIVWDITS